MTHTIRSAQPDSPGGMPDDRGAAPADAAQKPPARPRKERDPFFDNAKYFAILLVVVGHSLANLLDVPLAKGLYIYIYMFHMPLFILITGYLSRNWTFSSNKARKLITHVGFPYLVFETLYELFDWLGGGNGSGLSLLDPYYLTWFLCALFLWRLSTPVWQQLRWPLGIAVLISLLSYTSDLGGIFDIHRVLGLLPFYVLGLNLKPEHFELLKKPIARPIGAAVLAVGLGGAYFAMDRMSRDWIYWKDPSSALGVTNLTSVVMRMAMLVCAVVLVFAFISIIPRGRYWFSTLGAATLYTYLLHGFIVRLFDYTGWWGADWMHTLPGVFIVCGFACVVGTLLSTKPVIKSTSWALEPNITWIFTALRRPAGAGSRPERAGRK